MKPAGSVFIQTVQLYKSPLRMRLLGQRPRYQEGPPEGAGHVRLPPLGAGKAEEPICEAPPGSYSAIENLTMTPVRYPTGSQAAHRRRHAGSLEALRVTRPEAVASWRSELSSLCHVNPPSDWTHPSIMHLSSFRGALQSIENDPAQHRPGFTVCEWSVVISWPHPEG